MPSTSTDRIDGLTTSVAIKAPCRVATTTNITLSGLQTIDGITVVADDRVLVKNQTAAAENGIWIVSSTAWSRARDFNGSRDAVKGTMVIVHSGTDNARSTWQVSAADPLYIGTTEITFALANDVNFADALAASSGSSLIGGINRVVSSIAALRALSKTAASTKAFVTGYYTDGDGGGGAYYYDSADTTSADNGGTIIVATDGGRWKLSATTFISVKQFGAKGDAEGYTSGAITATSKTFTCTGITFDSSYVGKTVVVPGAGAAGVTLSTTIASINGASSVELTVAASTTVSGKTGYVGTDDTSKIQAAIDYAYSQRSDDLDGQPVVWMPNGWYLQTASLALYDYSALHGESYRGVKLVGSLAVSFLRGQHGESPALGSRMTGWNLCDITMVNASRLTGSIGLNMRGAGYATIERVYAYTMATGLATNNEVYYCKFIACLFHGDTAAYLKSDGGGNCFYGCDFNSEVISVDIAQGTWDFFGGTMDVNTTTATHIIRFGTAGADCVVNVYGTYVEGLALGTLTAEVGANTTRSGFWGVHRHNILGSITNNAPEGQFICDMGTYFNPITRTQKISLGLGIDVNPSAYLKATATNYVKVMDQSDSGVADLQVRSSYVQAISSRTDGQAPNVLRGVAEIVEPATTAAVTFAVAQGFASYGTFLTVSDDTGSVAGAHNAWVSNQGTGGFTINLDASPGAGNTVYVNWMIVG